MRMKKTKLDSNKIIKVPPRMEKMGPEGKVLIAMILGFLLGMILISCDEKPRTKQIPKNPEVLSKESENYYQRVVEYTYEGCEYIKVGYGKSVWGSHKGNCKNPIHKK